MRALPAKLAPRFRLVLVLVLVLASPRSQAAPPTSADALVKIDPQTKEVIKGALKYLAAQQHFNGSWSAKDGPAGYPVAITGYVLLAFMANGHLPGEGEYSKNVTAGMQYLLDRVQPDGQFGDVQPGQYMYSHGMGTIALAEMYGQSQSPALRPKLERLIQLILKAQSPQGGWRYSPQPRDSDVSVTVMQVVALRAAQESGMSVPQAAIERATAYVGSCFDEKSGGFAYQPGQGAGFARTAAAIYSLQVLGKYDDRRVKAGSDYLFNTVKQQRGGHWTYGSYYAAPAQYMIGGETWRNWYTQTKTLLMSEVQRQGDQAHWESKGGNDVGPVFNTAVFVHILAIPYHYLPLYQR